MVEHLVFFKVKPEFDEQHFQTALARFQEIKTAVTGVVDLTFGRNFCDRNKGFQFGLMVRLADKDALQRYQAHPLHQSLVQECIKPHLEDIIAIDYEF